MTICRAFSVFLIFCILSLFLISVLWKIPISFPASQTSKIYVILNGQNIFPYPLSLLLLHSTSIAPSHNSIIQPCPCPLQPTSPSPHQLQSSFFLLGVTTWSATLLQYDLAQLQTRLDEEHGWSEILPKLHHQKHRQRPKQRKCP